MSILHLARLIQAVCQPITGERASGTVVLKSATDDPVQLDFGLALFPIVNGSTRYDLPFKIARNPAVAKGTWTVPTAGTPIPIFSNIGGARHNLPAGTRFVIDQPFKPELRSKPVTQTGTSGGEDPTGDLSLYQFVTYESFGSKPSLELFQSDIGGKFPAAIMTWVESEPADGLASSAVTRPTHRGRGEMSYAEIFEILIISSRSDSEVERRGQGLRILDEMSGLLIDRQSVDGEGFSSPGGIHIKRRYRASNGTEGFYKVFQVFGLQISVTSTIEQRDTREYALLRKFKIDAPVHDPAAADLPLVVNNLVNNPQT
jgi:hypothetical protein